MYILCAKAFKVIKQISVTLVQRQSFIHFVYKSFPRLRKGGYFVNALDLMLNGHTEIFFCPQFISVSIVANNSSEELDSFSIALYGALNCYVAAQGNVKYFTPLKKYL